MSMAVISALIVWPVVYGAFYALLYAISALRNKRDPWKTAVSALEWAVILVVVLTILSLLSLFRPAGESIMKGM